MNDADQNTERNTGRTTGLMLDAMAQASLNRGKWIVFHDHGDQTHAAAIALQTVMQQMADALGLDYDIGAGLCSIGSDFSVRWPKEQAEPATVSESATEWHSVADSLPEEGERVLIATPSTVMIGIMAGMEERDPSLPVFIGRDHWCIGGVKYWSRLPSVPHSVEATDKPKDAMEALKEPVKATCTCSYVGAGGSRPCEYCYARTRARMQQGGPPKGGANGDKPPLDLYEKCVYAGETQVPEVFVAGRWHPLTDYSVSNLHEQYKDVGTGSGGDHLTGPSHGRAGDGVAEYIDACDAAAAGDKTRVTHGFVRDYLTKQGSTATRND